MVPALAAQLPENDSALVADARRGSEEAFEELYRRFHSRIYALALRMTRDFGEAEESVQEVFLAAWRSLDAFRGESAFGTWLHAIAIRSLVSRHRRTVRRAEETIEGDVARLRVVLPETSIDLERAIGRLPDGARAVLLLHDVHGHKCREIAEMLGIAVGTVKSQLHRARRLVEEALQS